MSESKSSARLPLPTPRSRAASVSSTPRSRLQPALPETAFKDGSNVWRALKSGDRDLTTDEKVQIVAATHNLFLKVRELPGSKQEEQNKKFGTAQFARGVTSQRNHNTEYQFFKILNQWLETDEDQYDAPAIVVGRTKMSAAQITKALSTVGAERTALATYLTASLERSTAVAESNNPCILNGPLRMAVISGLHQSARTPSPFSLD